MGNRHKNIKPIYNLVGVNKNCNFKETKFCRVFPTQFIRYPKVYLKQIWISITHYVQILIQILFDIHFNSISNLPILVILLFRNNVPSRHFLTLLVSLLLLPLLRLIFPQHHRHCLSQKSLHKF